MDDAKIMKLIKRVIWLGVLGIFALILGLTTWFTTTEGHIYYVQNKLTGGNQSLFRTGNPFEIAGVHSDFRVQSSRHNRHDYGRSGKLYTKPKSSWRSIRGYLHRHGPYDFPFQTSG